MTPDNYTTQSAKQKALLQAVTDHVQDPDTPAADAAAAATARAAMLAAKFSEQPNNVQALTSPAPTTGL